MKKEKKKTLEKNKTLQPQPEFYLAANNPVINELCSI